MNARVRKQIRARAGARRDETTERGVILVWLATMMVVLLGMGALGIDVAHLQHVKTDAQKAADAAALAGAVYLPENEGTGAAQARAIAGKNGFTNVPVAQRDASRPSQMNVEVSKTVDNFLAGVLGIGSSTVKAKASAEYSKPVALGSPANQYGNDPESSGAPGSTSYPNLWGNVASKGSPKANGDAYQAGGCGSADNCSGTNTDYDPNGYYYQIHFNSSATVDLEIFDPGFVEVGNNCGNNNAPDGAGTLGSNLVGAATLTPAQVRGWPGVLPNPVDRYKPVTDTTASPVVTNPANRYCVGDHGFGNASQLPATTYRVSGPAELPGQPTTADPDPGACVQTTFPGFAGNLQTQLQSNTKMNVQPTNLFLGEYFRQWWKMCTISGTAGQDYFVQVKGDAAGSGHNRFAIRAKNGGTAVSISGNAKMGAYANAAVGTHAKFYLARVLPSAAGKTLILSFFDIGDGSGVTGTLTIEPPSGPGESGGSFANCRYTPPPGNATGPPFGTFVNTSSGCAITNVNTGQYNGQWVQVEVPIPASYTCNFGNAFGCWLKIDYFFSGAGGTLQDTTSWSAVLDGDPVRLVK